MYRTLHRASYCMPRTFHVIVVWSPSSISRWDNCLRSARKTSLSSCLNIRRYSSQQLLLKFVFVDLLTSVMRMPIQELCNVSCNNSAYVDCDFLRLWPPAKRRGI